MNTSGEVADLMVKEGLQITDEVVKLTGLGVKNLAAIIIALLKEDNKLQGKTNLKKLLKSDKPLCILQIKEDDINKFNKEAKKYGVLFTAVTDKTNDSGLCDIIAKQDDVTKLNYIMEKLGYTAPEIEPEIEIETKTREKGEVTPKNSEPRARENPHGRESGKSKATEKGDSITDDKPSVKVKLENLKKEKKKAEKAKGKTPEKTKAPSKSAKKKKTKKKGKSR